MGSTTGAVLSCAALVAACAASAAQATRNPPVVHRFRAFIGKVQRTVAGVAPWLLTTIYRSADRTVNPRD
jgi:hypothetical protein